MKVPMPGWHSLVAPEGLGSHGWHCWEPNVNVGKPPQDLHQFPQVLLDGAWHLAHPRIISEAQAGVDDGMSGFGIPLGIWERKSSMESSVGFFLFLCSVGFFCSVGLFLLSSPVLSFLFSGFNAYSDTQW